MVIPHIVTESGGFIPTVLMLGDPKRAQRIVELFMDDARPVTDVCEMLGFTGTMDSRSLSVMGSGIGQSSFTIYATELFSQFGVKRIIRVDTVGVLSPKVKVGDVIAATGAHTSSSMNQLRVPDVNFNAVTDFRLTSATYQASQLEGAQVGRAVHLDTITSRDHSYFTSQGQTEMLASYGVLGAEVKAAVLYGVVAEYDKQALAILTVSGHLLDHSSNMSATEHETRFTGSLHLAVATAHS